MCVFFCFLFFCLFVYLFVCRLVVCLFLLLLLGGLGEGGGKHTVGRLFSFMRPSAICTFVHTFVLPKKQKIVIKTYEAVIASTTVTPNWLTQFCLAYSSIAG